MIGLLAFALVGCYLTFLTDTTALHGQGIGFEVSACIGISLVCAMMIASLDGSIIPILFKKIGIDPAVASGPLITTVNDLVAVCTYYGLSLLLFVKLGLFAFAG